MISRHFFAAPLKATFCLIKTENKTEKSLTQLSHYCFEYRSYFDQKGLIFFPKKVLTLAKLRRFFYKTCKISVVFSETTYLCVFKVSNFSTKFQVFTIILMGFRQENVILPPSPPQNEPLKSPPRLGLTRILVQTQSKIFYRLSTKGFHNLAKNHYFYDSIMGVESSS